MAEQSDPEAAKAGLSDTVAAATTATGGIALDATILDAAAAPESPASPLAATLLGSTVLPPITAARATDLERNARYECKKIIGAGGMGEVSLAEDRDIGRMVAVKHLSASAMKGAGLARFAEEVRTVGALEHPNIVPIHDVGVGDDGRYYFIMKHIDGETLESIIEKLRGGDSAVHAQWSIERRVEVFQGILQALAFAHARGIVHRDIKPANVMVGPYGEVVLMDWGVAKSGAARQSALPPAPQDPSAEAPVKETRERLFTTQKGALVGTPAYMSPEQARGEADSVDERSDTYSACVLFAELLTLRHYLDDKTTLPAMLEGVLEEEYTHTKHALTVHPYQREMPAELVHFLFKGMKKDPAERFQTVAEMLDRLEQLHEGKIPIQCHVTFSKRLFRELGRFTDRSPHAAFAGVVAGFGLLVFALMSLVRLALVR